MPHCIRFVLVACLTGFAAEDAFAQHRTRNVVLVTLDGARRQEIFGGLDLDVLRSTAPGKAPKTLPSYRKYWAETPEARRSKLMPFFWGTLMAQGSIAGNHSLGSIVRVTNGHRFSYPGYSEILTGEAHDDVIKSNDAVQNPYETVLEFARRGLKLDSRQVAAFASWATIAEIGMHTPGAVTINAGAQPWVSDDPALGTVNDLLSDVLLPWELVRPDAFTFRLAMGYLRTHRPRVFYLALDETDDWAHDGKYEQVLESYARTDRQLRELWQWLESEPQYRGTTTLIVTTDHGRGDTPGDWRHHGKDVEGAQHIWMAFVSPDSPLRGEWRGGAPAFQNQVASTVARLLGLDLSELRPTAGRPLLRLWGEGAR
jgi:Type I phosphodiesterase / nucleotide pyrophosphatase